MDTLFTADPDHDGAANGEEYAAGTLPDDPSSSRSYNLTFVENGGNEYPTITFDRITVDPEISRTGAVSNAGGLQTGDFDSADGTEIQTGTSEIGGFYEEVIYRSNTPVNASDAQFIRVETSFTPTP